MKLDGRIHAAPGAISGPARRAPARRACVVAVACLAPFLVGCGRPSVADRLTAVVESGGVYWHQETPSPARQDALYGDQGGTLPSAQDWTLANRLRKDADARAVLDAGEAVVPELVSLLDDGHLRTAAAVFLGEIGGEAAARTLLARWRRMRESRLSKDVVIYMADRADPHATCSTVNRYDGVDAGFYGELLFALAYCGLPVSAEIAADTRAAMDEGERRVAGGEPARCMEDVPPSERHPHGTTEYWYIAPVETAREGLELLAMVGAPEAQALFDRALDSPVRALQVEAVRDALYLGDEAKPLIPSLARFLDDPGMREEALYGIALLLHTRLPDREHTDAEGQRLVDETKGKLRELGYLPR